MRLDHPAHGDSERQRGQHASAIGDPARAIERALAEIAARSKVDAPGEVEVAT